jgi:murein DD-endopeptidase MepM/ murein hydrolase activator NlpD
VKRALLLLPLAGCVAPAAVPLAAAPPAAPVAQRAEIRIDGRIEQGAVLNGSAPGAGAVGLGSDEVPVAPDGRFVIGLDRDAPASLTLQVRYPDGRLIERVLAVAPRSWRLEHVSAARRPSIPSAEFERLRAPEIAQINAARAVNATSDGWRQRFVWPARGRISGVFGSQRIYRGEPGAYHSGVDVAGGAGAPVVAPADGVVVLAAADKPFTLEGHLLIIDHGMGLNSAFLHLSQIDVKQGDRVRQGQRIGAIGASGRTTGPHLHWAIKWRSARVDPVSLTGPMPGQDMRKVPVVEN